MKHKTTRTKTTRSKSASHHGIAGDDKSNRKIYRVCFSYKQWGDRFIKATSAEEAREKANLIHTVETGFWRDCPETFDVIEIDLIEPEAMPKDAVILPMPD
jgi:hypothetical protein